MKKLFINLFLLIPFLLQAQNKFVIKGKVKNIQYPAKVYLSYQRDGEKSHWDSTVVRNGEFEFKGSIADTAYGTIYINYVGKSLDDIWKKDKVDIKSLYIAPGTTILSGDDSVKYAKMSGSKLNADRFKMGQLLTFNMDFDERKRVAELFIKDNPDAYVALDYGLLDISRYNFNADSMQTLFNMLSANIRHTKEGIAFQARIDAHRKTSAGAFAPDFTITDTSGKPVSLYSFRGKYILLDFWASWCVPCRHNNPEIVKLYNQYKDRNFVILGISLDNQDERGAWIKAIKQDGLQWLQLSELKGWKSSVALLYDVNSIPQTFLIGPDGRIVGQGLSHESLEQILSDALK